MEVLLYASFKMKGPDGWPLIGNALEFLGCGEGKSYGFNVLFVMVLVRSL